MRPNQYSRWVDPAPLEVERPRLPWWTMLPRKLLLAASPVIVVVVAVMALVFAARRVWRYPLFVIGGTLLASLGVGCSWWVPGELVSEPVGVVHVSEEGLDHYAHVLNQHTLLVVG